MSKKNFLLTLLLFSLILTGCSDEEKIELPEISGIESEFTILENETIEFTPKVTSDYKVSYSWLLDGKEVANTLNYTFESDVAGEFKLVFRAANEGGTSHQEVLITVLERGDAPAIKGLEKKYVIKVGDELDFNPEVVSEHEVTYTWLVDDEVKGDEQQFNFNTTEAGTYKIVLKATNQGGTTESEALVIVNPASVITLNASAYNILTIDLPKYINKEDEIELEVSESASELYRLTQNEEGDILFAAAKPGNYGVKISSGDFEFDFDVSVIDNKEITAYTSQVFDYMPAPGQFVNKMPKYEEGDTHEDMVAKVANTITGSKASFITLGGWGGYVVLGFDHTIVNVEGKRDFKIHGNSFAGSAEPGVIWVAYDKNKNGKPDDDEWYEIAGSGNFTAENEEWYNDIVKNGGDASTYRDYEMTYYRPEIEDNNVSDTYIRWTNNKGKEGYKSKISFHRQPYYPQWISEDKIIFNGIRLADNGVDRSGTGTNLYFSFYSYGYVDNYPNDDKRAAIDIDWAIDKDGNPANLPGIDFVKVVSAVDKENGWLGEVSTEVGKGEDLHMNEESIDSKL